GGEHVEIGLLERRTLCRDGAEQRAAHALEAQIAASRRLELRDRPAHRALGACDPKEATDHNADDEDAKAEEADDPFRRAPRHQNDSPIEKCSRQFWCSSPYARSTRQEPRSAR